MGSPPRNHVKPILVAALLIVAAVAVVVTVRNWMGGIAPLWPVYDKLEFSSIEVFKGVSSYWIQLTVRNMGGTHELTIGRILIDGKLLAEYSSPILNSTFYPASGTLDTGEKGVITIGVDSRNIPPFTPGTSIKVSVFTTGGIEFSKNVTLT